MQTIYCPSCGTIMRESRNVVLPRRMLGPYKTSVFMPRIDWNCGERDWRLRGNSRISRKGYGSESFSRETFRGIGFEARGGCQRRRRRERFFKEVEAGFPSG